MEKATFRLPAWEMNRLREESQRQGRSLNSVAIDVIGRGLGRQPREDEILHLLGPMVARPALSTYQPPLEPSKELPALDDALEWTRGER